jgi:hypothetical protein
VWLARSLVLVWQTVTVALRLNRSSGGSADQVAPPTTTAFAPSIWICANEERMIRPAPARPSRHAERVVRRLPDEIRRHPTDQTLERLRP